MQLRKLLLKLVESDKLDRLGLGVYKFEIEKGKVFFLEKEEILHAGRACADIGDFCGDWEGWGYLRVDGDGYKDGEEILKGYDPLGLGEKDTALSPIEKAITQGQSIEHPKTSGEESSSLNIATVKTIYNADGKQGGYTMAGKAEADSVITLYIYSDIPIVTTVTTDEYGNWEYHFTETLEDGDHEVYIAINDETGKVVKKSSPLSFLVREAQAGSNDIPNAPSSEVSDNMINYYLYAAVGLIIMGVSIFLVALLKSRNKNKQTNDKA